jgi:hypothetical protein
MATLIKPDFSIETIEVRNFKHAQTLVGGLVELVHLRDRVMLVHEEAIMNNDPYNAVATDLATGYGYGPILGTAVILTEEEATRVLQ